LDRIAFARRVAATFLLLVAGGLVTGNKPASRSSTGRTPTVQHVLVPVRRMTGGIYYEHAHRLLGALVGLTTVTLAAHLATSRSAPS
jgi:hypothetical protein